MPKMGDQWQSSIKIIEAIGMKKIREEVKYGAIRSVYGFDFVSNVPVPKAPPVTPPLHPASLQQRMREKMSRLWSKVSSGLTEFKTAIKGFFQKLFKHSQSSF